MCERMSAVALEQKLSIATVFLQLLGKRDGQTPVFITLLTSWQSQLFMLCFWAQRCANHRWPILGTFVPSACIEEWHRVGEFEYRHITTAP